MQLQELLELETSVWNALMVGDAESDRERLSDDFVGVYPTGIVGRDVHAGQLAAGATVAEVKLSESQLLEAGPGAVLLVYRADYRRPGRETWEAMYISSLWCDRGDRWLNTFSQDTPVDATAAVP